jgi:hypothetical protein
MDIDMIRIPNKEKDSNDLAFVYISENISGDPHLSGLYLTISNHIEAFSLNDENRIKQMKYDDKNGYHYSIYVSDRFGMNTFQAVIKEFAKNSHIYEIRINEKYTKHRLFFFALTNDAGELSLLTYGFGKLTSENQSDDLTNYFIDESNEIRKDILLCNDFRKWM